MRGSGGWVSKHAVEKTGCTEWGAQSCPPSLNGRSCPIPAGTHAIAHFPPPACSYPTLLTICNGDPATAQRYSGELKSEPLTQHLQKYAGGKKCSAGGARGLLQSLNVIPWKLLS